MSKENRALIRRWFKEVWDKGRAEAIDEMFAPAGVAHGLSGDEAVRGPEGFKAFHRSFREAFPDVSVKVVDTVTEGDKIAARCLVRATHKGGSLGFAATHKPVEFEGILIARIKGGKIAESWNNFDFLRLYQQLDLVPDPTSKS
jgi:steroid delta-isomerase-like uncharacterized protein